MRRAPRAVLGAIGAAAAALLGTDPAIPVAVALVVVAGAVLGGIGWVALGDDPLASRRRVAGATALGALAVAVRLGLGELAAGPAVVSLPEGSGPWDATVVSVGSPKDGTQRATLRVEIPTRPLLAATLPRYPELIAGDRVVVAGRVLAPRDDDYGRYLVRNRIAGSLLARRLERQTDGTGPAALLERIRDGAGDALARVLPEPEAGLASGILVGLRERVDRGLADDFTTAGTSHIVAISGWNIAIVGATVAAATRRRCSRRLRSVLTLGAIVAYTAIAGASSSVVRAALMAGVVLLARESGRTGRALTALAWAVVLLLLVEPRFVRDVGLQLSAIATAGLIAWGTPLTERLRRAGGGRLPAWLAETLGVSLAAQAATLPLIVATFGRLSLVAPLANLLVVPLVPPAMAAGGIALAGGIAVAGGLPLGAGTLLALPAWLLLTAIRRAVEGAAAIPFASLEIDASLTVGLGLLALGAVALAGTATGRRACARAVARAGGAIGILRRATAPDGRRRRVAAAVIGPGILALVIAVAARPDGVPSVAILDVGQADAILVEGEAGGRLLVDAAGDPGRLLVALDDRIPPWDRRIDLVVITHPHEDHIGGLPALLSRYRVGRILGTGRHGTGPAADALPAALDESGRIVERIRPGDRLALDGVRLVVLWPPRERVVDPGTDGRTVNDSSIVLLGSAAGGRFLLVGDAEEDVDPLLLRTGLPRVDLLKVSHHGSRTATSAALIEAVQPAIAAISVGSRNSYGHPSPATIARLETSGARVVRTDRDGTIEVSFGPDGIRLRTERGTDVDLPRREPTAAVPDPALYHRPDGDPGPRRRGRPPSLARSPRLAPAAFASGRGDRGVARRPDRRAREGPRQAPRRGRRTPPRRRQADGPPGRPGDRAAPAR